MNQPLNESGAGQPQGATAHIVPGDRMLCPDATLPTPNFQTLSS